MVDFNEDMGLGRQAEWPKLHREGTYGCYQDVFHCSFHQRPVHREGLAVAAHGSRNQESVSSEFSNFDFVSFTAAFHIQVEH